MKYNWKFPEVGLVLFCALLLSACQPASQAVHSAVIPVISSSSGEEVPTRSEQTYPSVDDLTSKLERRELFTPTPAPPRVTRSTVPAFAPIDNPEKCDGQGSLEIEERTLALINLERLKFDLPPLMMNNFLVAAARHHSADMACNNYFNHYSLDGSSPFVRMNTAGYMMSYAGENIYAGPDENNTPEVAVRLWMNSSTHRAAILNPNYTEAGAGYYFYQPSRYDGYYTIDFASPADLKEAAE